MTNKGERQRVTKLKFLKRLKKYCLLEDFRKGKGNFFVFKSTGSPCSCQTCAGEKYSRKLKHKDQDLPVNPNGKVPKKFFTVKKLW